MFFTHVVAYTCPAHGFGLATVESDMPELSDEQLTAAAGIPMMWLGQESQYQVQRYSPLYDETFTETIPFTHVSGFVKYLLTETDTSAVAVLDDTYADVTSTFMKAHEDESYE